MSTVINDTPIVASLATVKARKSGSFTASATYADVTFDVTDIETDDITVKHDDSNTDRIQVFETGLYYVGYSVSLSPTGAPSVLEARIRKNDVNILGEGFSTRSDETEDGMLNVVSPVELSSGDFISLQIQASGGTETVQADAILFVTRMKGTQGDTGADGIQGEPGSGSSIAIQEEGSTLANAPHTIINFKGGKVTATDAGTGVADITVSGTPDAHAASHTDGSDDIQDATASVKGLATAAQITKLDGIATGAEVNVNADWNSGAGDSQILNKPTDLTVLSSHNVTELSDVTSAGSGAIITAGERTAITHSNRAQLDLVTDGDHDVRTDNPHGVDADQVDDTATTNKFVTAGDITNLGNLSGTNTGDQTITLTGDVTGTGTGSFATTVPSASVTQHEGDITHNNIGSLEGDGPEYNHITDAEKDKIDNVVSNGSGDHWQTGLVITEHDPENQTVDYTAGTFMVNGVFKTIASNGVYDLENGYGAVDHFASLGSYQKALVEIYVDGDEVVKSQIGTVVGKSDLVFPPLHLEDTVCIAYVLIRSNNSGDPKDIKDDHITDCRSSFGVNTDELVKVSADDTLPGHLFESLDNAGNVTFAIVNAGANETVKGDVDLSGKSDTSHTHPGPIELTPVISPAQITENTNDWDPTGLSTATAIRIDLDNNHDLTGIKAPSPATYKKLLLINYSVKNLSLKNANSNSSAANRFEFDNNYSLAAKMTCELIYDVGASRWRYIGII